MEVRAQAQRAVGALECNIPVRRCSGGDAARSPARARAARTRDCDPGSDGWAAYRVRRHAQVFIGGQAACANAPRARPDTAHAST
eukprot:1503145-Alexandrium_andersonii.AAC.1